MLHGRRILGRAWWIVAILGAVLVASASATVLVGLPSREAGNRARLPEAPRRPARLIATHPATCKPGRPPHERLIQKPTWLHHVAITEYYSSPERWFVGRRVSTPGLRGKHRVDWLYSARGVAMEGDGIGLDGSHYHIDALGHGGWVNAAGHPTRPGRCAGHWSAGRPSWLQGGWRNRAGEVTFPLARGGWSHGVGRRRLSYEGVTFAPGSSLALHAYRTVAVDPRLIPLGSRLYVPSYRHINTGWFVAQDTGGAIIGHHIDVYRPPPPTPLDGGRYLKDQRIKVIPPGS